MSKVAVHYYLLVNFEFYFISDRFTPEKTQKCHGVAALSSEKTLGVQRVNNSLARISQRVHGIFNISLTRNPCLFAFSPGRGRFQIGYERDMVSSSQRRGAGHSAGPAGDFEHSPGLLAR